MSAHANRIRRYHDGRHDERGQRLQIFVEACHDGRRLETLRGLTPYEFTCKSSTEQPARFKLDPSQHTLGPNMQMTARNLSRAFDEISDAITIDIVADYSLRRRESRHADRADRRRYALS